MLPNEINQCPLLHNEYRRAPGIHQHYEKHQNLKLGLGSPTSINQQWGADLTYIKVARQWRYLAVVIDLHSRRVIGWSLGPQKSTELTIVNANPNLTHFSPKSPI
jgi:transposase InsO family protein